MENGKVTLVAKTVPIIDGIDSAQELIAYIARVSNQKNQLKNETAPKLLDYLLEHKHWSPFEMVNLVMEIITPRDISRQILRHGKAFGLQEFSQRYAEVTKDQFVLREARLQDKTNRQNSIRPDNLELQERWDMMQEEVFQHAKVAYDWAIANGIAKEQARVVLPEGNILSRLYLNGCLRSWIHYTDIRIYGGAQKEHQDIAVKCQNIVIQEFPALKGYL